MGVIMSINWGLNFLVAMTWPPMEYDRFNDKGYGFIFYAGCCAVGWVFIFL